MLTDSYSLANVLFRLLMRGDPLGRSVGFGQGMPDRKGRDGALRHQPVFVYDPDNNANRPVRGVHDNVINAWRLYPDFIKQAFIDAFTVCIKDPDRRKAENVLAQVVRAAEK
jgi:hypothetical protein